MGVRTLIGLAAVMVLVGACDPGSGEGSTTAPAASSNSVAFEPLVLDEDQVRLYVAYANLLLEDTPWNPEAMGESWGAMLRTGGHAVCRSIAAGNPMTETITKALAETPAGSRDLSSFQGDGLADVIDLISVLFTGGADAYCPQFNDLRTTSTRSSVRGRPSVVASARRSRRAKTCGDST